MPFELLLTCRQHILQEQQKLGQAATGDLTILLNAYIDLLFVVFNTYCCV